MATILPLTDTVPQNMLRFYLYFSQPMSIDDPYKYLSLLHSDGREVHDAFVEFSQGLWDKDRTRLTVL